MIALASLVSRLSGSKWRIFFDILIIFLIRPAYSGYHLRFIVQPRHSFGRSKRVGFCRLSVYSKRLHAIGFDAIRSAYLNPPGVPLRGEHFGSRQYFGENSPGSFSCGHAASAIFLFDLQGCGWRSHRNRAWQNRFERFVRRGDMIISLGAGWGIPDHMKHIAEAKRCYGIKFSILVHDLIPIKYQSFVEPHHAVQYLNWLQDAIPVADIVFTNSKYSRAALIEWAAEFGWRLPRVEVVEPGSGFGGRLAAANQTMTSLPARYVLFVSTIEIRKNHRLLVRVWQRLLERHGADRYRP